MAVREVVGPSVDFCYKFRDEEIPFYQEVKNIYVAYRQCYSKTPEIEKDFTDREIASLREHIAEWLPTTDIKVDAETYFNDMREKYGDINTLTFLRHCWFIKSHLMHESPFEHSSLTMKIYDVSRSLTHQLVRHRIASYSMASQRYIGEDKADIELVIPEAILNNAEAELSVMEYFSKLPEMIEKLKAMGIKNEDIRCIYPNAMATSIVTTMNFRELKHFITLRSSSHAQQEIRELATLIWMFVNYHMPFIWKDVIE